MPSRVYLIALKPVIKNKLSETLNLVEPKKRVNVTSISAYFSLSDHNGSGIASCA